MPPARTGIADYSVELLRELREYYDVDIVVSQDRVDHTSVGDRCTVRTLDWFNRQATAGERIVYHFGNSPFHSHMFEMLERRPGVVVLHDFFLSGIMQHREEHMGESHIWSKALYHSHGYRALAERFTKETPDDTIWRYPANLSILQLATGVVVHSTFSRELARQWFGDALPRDWIIIPQLGTATRQVARDDARRELHLGSGDYIVCSFGLVGSHKNHHRLLTAWLASRLTKEQGCRLVFVGETPENAYSRALIDIIGTSGMQDKISVTGFVAPEVYLMWVAAADLAVQLRSNSRGETSRAVLDCMSYGLPTIVNRHGAMAELPANSVFMIEDLFTDEELTQALELSYSDKITRENIGQRARTVAEEIHSPRKVASLYFEAIEKFHDKARRSRFGLITSIASLDAATVSEKDLQEVAESISQSLPLIAPDRQLLVDVSELIQRDSGTGIQRVVRNVLKYFLDHPPAGFRVEPVYATESAPYRYARRFTMRLLGCPDTVLDDDLVEARAQDVFLGLDLQSFLVKAHAATFAHMRDRGVKLYFVVYDLLWTRMPHFFVEGAAESLDPWLEAVTASDGAVCISKTVADELYNYIISHPSGRLRRFDIGWFHLGADVLTETVNSRTAGSLHSNFHAAAVEPPFILMVGTIEPRKGYAQALSAFEDLWTRGVDVRLAIVGRQGWMVENLVGQIRKHPELGRKLFWFPQSDDKTLTALYDNASGLLMASEGEGFGLPLIEAAYHKCPILARDIPVFREIAGEHATYFRAANSAELGDALMNWIAALQKGVAPQSAGIPIQTWAESAEQLLSVILGGNWYRQFDPKAVAMNTPGLTTAVGVRQPLADAIDSERPNQSHYP